VCLGALARVRKWLSEIFLPAHFLLSLGALLALWNHLKLKQLFAHVYVLAAFCLWGSFIALDLLCYILRNFSFSRPPLGRTKVALIGPPDNRREMMRLDVVVPRPWSMKAGHYVYLWMPGVNFWSILHSDPFTIAWWQEQEGRLTLSFLVKPTHGVTEALAKQEHSLFTFIGGPHGITSQMGDFGTVVMITSGVAIAAHMPYIKELVEGYRLRKVRTRRLLLVWQVERRRECVTLTRSPLLTTRPEHTAWVKSWMEEVLPKDREYVGLLFGTFLWQG